MRIAFLGVSHWHAPLYYAPAARLAGVRIVGVSDRDAAHAARAGQRLEARAFTNDRELLEATRPDFVFAFGRHCDMPEISAALVDAGVPFLLEKPAGLTGRAARALAAQVRAKGLYAGTGFNFRVSTLYAKIQALIAEEGVTHASFRYIAGGPDRYREADCAWMLDPAQSGGGSTINLGIHFLDMARTFAGGPPYEVAALMTNATWQLPIEDYSTVVVRTPRAAWTVETGYTFPGKLGVFDMRFSVRTARHYVVVRSDDCVEVHRTCDGHIETIATPVSNAAWYPVFVAETIDRFAKGKPPVADLDALGDAMELVDAAYASSQGGGARLQVPAKPPTGEGDARR